MAEAVVPRDHVRASSLVVRLVCSADPKRGVVWGQGFDVNVRFWGEVNGRRDRSL